MKEMDLDIKKISSVKELHAFMELPSPLNPLITFVDHAKPGHHNQTKDQKLMLDFYNISIKRSFKGKLKYGKNHYDFDDGTMSFIAPNQIISVDSEDDINKDGWSLLFHPDLIRQYPLGKAIKNFGFFSYGVNEALHLSDEEEKTIEIIVQNIQKEINSRLDHFSQDVIVSNLELLLSYCHRFYSRQFITRKMATNDLLTNFENILDKYFNNNSALTLPTVEMLADELNGYLTEVAQPGDFQKAADLTAELISNKGTYGLDLFQDYNDAVKPANDYGKETIFAIDFGFNDPTYSGRTEQGTGGFGLNNLPVLHRWNYISLAGIDNSAGIDAVPQKINTTKQPMQRDVYNGRPYIRVAPWGPYTAEVAFADQVHDTRWDATFQTFWICNKTVAAGLTSTGTLKGVLVPTTVNSLTSYQPPTNGDTAILMPGTDVTMARRDGFKGLIVTPKQYSNNVFPVVKKFDDLLRTGMNDFSSRPVIAMRFSEVYLMNAEANYMAGSTTAAASSLNVIRQRAAFRVPADGAFIPKGQFSVTAANQAAANATAMLLTPAQLAQLAVPNNTVTGSALCGMDLILEEYTREFYGDLRRWYDLVRTRQLVRRLKMYNTPGAPNVQEFHMRRPIPQVQIDAVLTGPKYPQNNGY
jgi:hypothetical protein